MAKPGPLSGMSPRVQSHLQVVLDVHAEGLSPMTEGAWQLQDGAPEVVAEQFAIRALREMVAGVEDPDAPCEVTLRWVRDGRTLASQSFTTEAKWLADAGRCRRWVVPAAVALRDALLSYALSGQV